MQGRNLVVKCFAARIESPQRRAETGFEMLGADLRLFVRARDVHGLLKMIEQSARISVGGFDQYGLRIGRDGVLCRFTGAHDQIG